MIAENGYHLPNVVISRKGRQLAAKLIDFGLSVICPAVSTDPWLADQADAWAAVGAVGSH